MKKKYAFILMLSIIMGVRVNAQKLPIGYITQFQEDFSKNKSLLNEFEFSNPVNWKIGHTVKNYFLQFSGNKNDSLPGSCKQNVALLSGLLFGDFIFEADIKIPVKELNPDQNICFILGLRDTAHYYAAQLIKNINDSTQRIYVVYDSIKTTLKVNGNNNVNWENEKWHKIKVIRNILAKTITVYIDNMNTPVMEATDRKLIMGYIGLGSTGIPFWLDNIKIWGATSIEQKAGIYK